MNRERPRAVMSVLVHLRADDVEGVRCSAGSTRSGPATGRLVPAGSPAATPLANKDEYHGRPPARAPGDAGQQKSVARTGNYVSGRRTTVADGPGIGDRQDPK
jgi:hypothetical protein